MSLSNCNLKCVSISCGGDAGQVKFDLPVEISPKSVKSVVLIQPLPSLLADATITFDAVQEKVILSNVLFIYSSFHFNYSILTCYNQRVRVTQKVLVIPADCSGGGGGSGEQGAQGTRGTQGRRGAQGSHGRQGTLGGQGKRGAQGTFGSQGSRGGQGFLGNQGALGEKGLVGNQGALGNQGSMGVRGNQGFNGTGGGGGSTDICQQLRQSELALSASFCKPCNPYTVLADPDPLTMRTNCRQFAQPAGTHIPCATLQVDNDYIHTTSDFNMFDFGNTFYLFDGCDSQHGCEFWVSASGKQRVVPFVIDQDCALLNANDGSTSTPSFATVQAIDIRCFKDKTYLLDNANQLYNSPLNYVGSTSPLYTINSVLPLKQFLINDSYLYVTDQTTSIQVFDSATGNTLIDTFPISSTLADMTVVDGILCVIFVGDIFTQIHLNPNGSFGVFSTILLTTNSTLQQPGLAVHPLLPIVFACTHTPNTIVLQEIYVGAAATPTLLASVTVPGVVVSGQFLNRHRPRYCDGIIQFISPTGKPTQSLVTVRQDDSNPALLTLISNIPLPSSIAGNVDAQFISNANGCFVFSDLTNVGQHLYLYRPLKTQQKYINLKPMNLPSSISAKFTTVPQTFDIGSGDTKGLVMPTLDNFISNFSDIDEPSPFLTNSVNIFTPQRSMLVHLDILLRVVADTPDSLQNWSLTVSAAFPELLTDEATFIGVRTFHIHGDLVVAGGTSLQMALFDPSPSLIIGKLTFCIQFLRYV